MTGPSSDSRQYAKANNDANRVRAVGRASKRAHQVEIPDALRV